MNAKARIVSVFMRKFLSVNSSFVFHDINKSLKGCIGNMFVGFRAETVCVFTRALHKHFMSVEQGLLIFEALQNAFIADMAIFKTDLGRSDFFANSHIKLAITD